MTGANVAQTASAHRNGIKVGIIDTGIDIDHRAFGGSGVSGTTLFPTARIWPATISLRRLQCRWQRRGAGAPARHNPTTATATARTWRASSAAMVRHQGCSASVTFGATRLRCTGTTSGDIMIAAMERRWPTACTSSIRASGHGPMPQYRRHKPRRGW